MNNEEFIEGLANVLPRADPLEFRKVQVGADEETLISDLNPAYDTENNRTRADGHRDGATYFVVKGRFDTDHIFINDVNVKVSISICNIFHTISIYPDSFIQFRDSHFQDGHFPVDKAALSFDILPHHSQTYNLSPEPPLANTTLQVFVPLPTAAYSVLYLNRTGYPVQLNLIKAIKTKTFND